MEHCICSQEQWRPFHIQTSSVFDVNEHDWRRIRKEQPITSIHVTFGKKKLKFVAYFPERQCRNTVSSFEIIYLISSKGHKFKDILFRMTVYTIFPRGETANANFDQPPPLHHRRSIARPPSSLFSSSSSPPCTRK